MWIKHSDGYGMTNLDNVERLCIAGRYIHAYTIDGKSHPVAAYDTAERAEVIWDNLSEMLDDTVMVMKKR